MERLRPAAATTAHTMAGLCFVVFTGVTVVVAGRSHIEFSRYALLARYVPLARFAPCCNMFSQRLISTPGTTRPVSQRLAAHFAVGGDCK